MNRVTSVDGRTELALGRDGLWYRLRRGTLDHPATLVGGPHADPRELLVRRVRAEQLRLL